MTIQPSHEELVQEVCAQVKEGEGNLLTVYKPHVSHTPRTVDYKRGCFPVDVSRLNRILEINTQEGWVIAEGNVTLDQLVTATLEFGMIPPVVPELRNFTVAGLINGRGLQSSSHKHCMFEWKGNIPEMEVVIGDGSVIVCNDKNHTDLFWHIKGCYGTLGFVTKAKIRLIPATKTVKSEYHVFDKIGEFVSFMESQLEKPQYLDGVVFAKDHAVAIVSDFVDRVPKGEEDLVFHPLYPESPGGEYYYQYVKNRTKDKKTFMDYIPTKEFVHRSERGLWWMTEAMVNDEQVRSHSVVKASRWLQTTTIQRN